MTKTCSNPICGHNEKTHKRGFCFIEGLQPKCPCKKFEAEDEIDEICDVCWETRKGCSCKKFTPTGMTLKKPQKGCGKVIYGDGKRWPLECNGKNLCPECSNNSPLDYDGEPSRKELGREDKTSKKSLKLSNSRGKGSDDNSKVNTLEPSGSKYKEMRDYAKVEMKKDKLSGSDFDLSKKKVNWNQGDIIPGSDICYEERHIKEFIRIIKEKADRQFVDGVDKAYLYGIIDKLAGKELSK